MKIYNFNDHLKGDTFKGMTFRMSNATTATPINLTDSEINIQFRVGSKTGRVQKHISIGNGITLTDAVNGVFNIDPIIKLNWYVNLYYYDVEITFLDGTIKTYFGGTLKVVQDTTNIE